MNAWLPAAGMVGGHGTGAMAGKVNNPDGNNQFTNADPYCPLTLRKAKAMLLLEQGATYKQVQAATGLAKDTITACRRGQYDVPQSMISALRAAECDKFTYAAHRILDTILDPSADDDTVKKATLVQRATAVGILYDKARLARGEPTSIEEHRLRGLTDEEIQSELRRLSDEMNTVEAEFEVAEPVQSDQPDESS